jgi:phosphoribosylformylglycinamidine synthase
MKVGIKVLLRDGVKDSQGTAVMNALESMGYKGIKDILVGKYIIVTMDEDTKESRILIKKMCDDLLANLVIEKYEIEYPLDLYDLQ